MSRVIQAGEFFVVGGPVQPDRLCYVERTADRVLETSIRAQRFSYVLAPRATGKSSVMGRTARALRRAGELAAVVDLAQLDARGESADAGRWLRSIAHRIAHELRLKVDVDQWWREKSALGEQRLDDFFWEIVLTNTTAPVTVFFDEVERAAGLPFAPELFATIRACYTRRAAEPDYARLNFVVLGVAAPHHLCPDERLSPFVDGEAVDLEDFDAQQSYQLAPGLGGEPALAQALMDRICVWTGGHPYLTQKVARAVARKGGKLEDVERAVKEQLLGAAASRDDPLLSHIRAMLSGRAPIKRRARACLYKIAKGAQVHWQRDSAPLEALRLAGVVAVDADGVAHYRNRIFAEAFGRRWLKANRPTTWRLVAGVAALLAVGALGGFWYQEYAPRPYLRALADDTAEVAALETAHARLRELPGFTETADELFTAALERRSTSAADDRTASDIDRALRNVLDRPDLADRLMQDFRLRQAVSATHREARDDALLYALQALPGEPARRLLAELIGADYRQLARVLEWPLRPASFVADWQARRLLGLDAELRLQSLDLDEPGAPTESATAFTVLEHRPLDRELDVAESGSAGAFTLTVLLDHGARDELALTLIAPSGAESGVIVVPRDGAGELALLANAGSPLAALSDEEREGVWRLSIVDRASGNDGALVSWALAFGAGGIPWRDVPEGGAAIPDAVRRAAAHVSVAPNGRVALARAAELGAVGALALWNLRDGSLLRDLTLPAAAAAVGFAANGSRMLAVAGNSVYVWSTADDAPPARIATQTSFAVAPALSPDGEYVMIAEEVEGAPPLFSLLRAADGVLLTSVEGVANVDSWLLGPQARYLVLRGGGADAIRVMDPRRGGAPRALLHRRAVERVLVLPSGATLLTVDAAGDIRAWQIGGSNGATSTVVGTTVDAESVSAADDGSRVAFAAHGATVRIADGRTGAPLQTLRLAPLRAAPATALSPEGRMLVTIAANEVRVWELETAAAEVLARAATEVTAVAIGGQGEIAALGFRGGYVRVLPVAALAAAETSPALDYFGHRGAVASLAINVEQNIVVSGGASDATLRIWDAASREPGTTLAHPGGGLLAVAISHDGRALASTTAASLRLWRVADRALLAEIATPAAAATALAFSDDALAIGDAAGGLRLVAAADAAPASARIELAAPPAWLAAGAAPGAWLVATDHWLHAIELADSGARVLHSRLLPAGYEPRAAAGGLSVYAVRGVGTSALALAEIALDAAAPPLELQAPELAKDWPAVLGRRVGDDGAIAPYAR